MKLSEMQTQDDAKEKELSAEKLKNLSHDELLEMLIDEVQTQKSNGTFNFEALCKGVEMMKPFVGQDTFKNLIAFVEKLK